jgi:hypothetical protein
MSYKNNIHLALNVLNTCRIYDASGGNASGYYFDKGLVAGVIKTLTDSLTKHEPLILRGKDIATPDISWICLLLKDSHFDEVLVQEAWDAMKERAGLAPINTKYEVLQ